MFALVALVLFALAAFGVDFKAVEIVPLGLAFLALHLIFDFRPWAGRINA